MRLRRTRRRAGARGGPHRGCRRRGSGRGRVRGRVDLPVPGKRLDVLDLEVRVRVVGRAVVDDAIVVLCRA